MQVRLALESEVAVLTQYSKEAFDTDVNVGGTEPGGPPEYDNVDWHREMLEQKHLYSAVVDGEVVGGTLVFEDEKNPNIMFVGRIFIAPQFLRKGYGIELMAGLERIFPERTDWRLDTPVWNKRTNSFYPKIGYREISRDDEAVYYQKVI